MEGTPEFKALVRAYRAGANWAYRHPFAEPEEGDAAAARYAKRYGTEAGKMYRNGLVCERWNPRDCQPVRDL